VCPHCRQTILESAAVCPSCRHHLRFEPGRADEARPSVKPLVVEGTIQLPSGVEPGEYSVLLTIRNERGEEVSRHVAGVGIIQPAERRSFTLTVEVFGAGKA
jgi:hypothetical protein